MKKFLCAVLALALSASLVSGCKSKEPEDKDKTGAKSSSSSSAQSDEEGGREIVVYSALPEEMTQAAVEGFGAYADVTVQVISDSAGRLISSIGTHTGLQADVLLGVGAEVVVQCADLFTPYVTSEADALDERFTDPDGLYTSLTPMPIVIMYNKKLTTKAPAGWKTLAAAAYKGGVAFANPDYSGTSYTALCAMALAAGEEDKPSYDFVEQFGANLDGEMMETISDVYSSVAGGQFAAGVTLESSVYKYMNAGYDETVAIAYPQEGTPVALEVSALVKGANNLEDAQAFIDYVSSAEYQSILVEKFGRRTIRTDSIDPRFCTEKKDISFSTLSPAEAVAMRDDLLPRFGAGTGEKEAKTEEISSSEAA